MQLLMVFNDTCGSRLADAYFAFGNNIARELGGGVVDKFVCHPAQTIKKMNRLWCK